MSRRRQKVRGCSSQVTSTREPASVGVTLHAQVAYDGFPSSVAERCTNLRSPATRASQRDLLFRFIARIAWQETTHSWPGSSAGGRSTVALMTGFHSGRRKGSVIVTKTASAGAGMAFVAEPLSTTTVRSYLTPVTAALAGNVSFEVRCFSTSGGAETGRR